MTAVYARIIMRYGAMFLISHGYLTEGEGSMIADDPDLAMLIEIAVGGAVAALSEAWYLVARSSGAST